MRRSVLVTSDCEFDPWRGRFIVVRPDVCLTVTGCDMVGFPECKEPPPITCVAAREIVKGPGTLFPMLNAKCSPGHV